MGEKKICQHWIRIHPYALTMMSAYNIWIYDRSGNNSSEDAMRRTSKAIVKLS